MHYIGHPKEYLFCMLDKKMNVLKELRFVLHFHNADIRKYSSSLSRSRTLFRIIVSGNLQAIQQWNETIFHKGLSIGGGLHYNEQNVPYNNIQVFDLP